MTPTVRIHYLRPPDRLEVYTQALVHEDGRVKVTLARNLPVDPPLRIGGRVALERGSDAVWFTFPGAWHDIGRFHRADGSFTGLYANVITPCVFQPGGEWETTDLFLDLWLPEGQGRATLLDEEELSRATERGHLSRELARRARAEAGRLQAELAGGRWPPPVVREWTLERALARQAPPSPPSATTWAAQSRARST